MKKNYTKKQIQEAINYWNKKLDEMKFPTHTTTNGTDLHDQYDDSYSNLTWGQIKNIINKNFKDDETIPMIALICGGHPIDTGVGEQVCYVDVLKNANNSKCIAFSMAGF